MLTRIGVALALVLVLPAAPVLSAQDAVEEVRLVAITDDEDQPFGFDPPELTVSAGTTVRWVNTIDVFHTVTFADSLDRRVPNGTFDQSLAAAGDTAQRMFDRPGSFFYFCQPHSTFMAATITVTPGAPESANDSGQSGVGKIVVIGVVIALGAAAVLALLHRRRTATSN